MSAGYSITQVESPTLAAFKAALGEAQLSWPFDDVLETHRHPGMRTDDGTIGLVLHALDFDRQRDRIEAVQSVMILGPRTAVVARWPGDGLDEAFAEPCVDRADLIRAAVEAVYDTDMEAMTDLEERIDDCELEVLDADGQGTSAQLIYHLEHELLTFRRSVSPMVGLLDKLGRRSDEEGRSLIAEWRDRYVHLMSQIEDMDSLLTSVLSVNLTLVSVRQNEDMRKIAAWGAIGIVPTAMAGIWGMNFRHMPELGWHVGYPLALASMALVCSLLYRFFKKSGWL